LLLGCGSGSSFMHRDPDRNTGPRGMRADPSGTAAAIKQLLRYDADKDGQVTRAEMEAGLRPDFAALDKNPDGKLNRDEVHEEKARCYKEDWPEYSPLLDWNQDGYIDFKEFASTLRSIFDQLDKNHDNVLDETELKMPHGPTLEEHHRPNGSY